MTLLSELWRRNVFRVAAAWAEVALLPPERLDRIEFEVRLPEAQGDR